MTARRFATAYARYLDGQLPGLGLPDTTSTARTQAGPAIPPARRTGKLTLHSIRSTPASAVFKIALRDRAHTFTAQLTLAPVSHRWLIVAIAPPDLDTILATAPPPPPQPTGSGPAERAARTFIGPYLAWLYRRALKRTLTAATSTLLQRLTAHPPRVPLTMQDLHPQVTAIAIRRRDRHWRALVNITDGQQTYELGLTLTHTHGRWRVSSVSNP